MAIIVKDKKDGEKYLLLGTGFGAYQSKKPNWFFGDLMADVDEGNFAMICVCTSKGKIGWLEYSDVVVDTVDGQKVESFF